LKTININLIDDTIKESNKSRIEVLSDNDDIDPRVKLASIITIASVCIVFVISFGVWSISSIMLKKTDKELANLKVEHEKASVELSRLMSNHKSLEKQNKILNLKLGVQKTIKSSVLPWHRILLDVSRAVPKNVKISEISEAQENQNDDQNSMITIKGEVSSNRTKNDSLKLISFLILNINNNAQPNSTLEKAKIKKIDFDDNSNTYNFEIASALKVNDNEKNTIGGK